jgi:hypothetical protein
VLFHFTLSNTGLPHPTGATTINLLAEKGIHPAWENPHSIKDRYYYLCPLPGHGNDSHPSFSVHSDGVQWHCFPCGLGGGPAKLLKLLGSEPIVRTSKPGKTAQKPTKKPRKEETINGCTLAQLAAGKNLPIEFLRSLGWYDTTYKGKPAVAVSWPSGIHYRVNLVGETKYKWRSGDHVSILGIERLEEVRRRGWALFVEGETDYAAGLLLGLPVMALPGASTFKKEWALQFQGCQIYVWKESDRGGETLVRKLADAFYGVQVIEAPPGVKDLCELQDQSGAGANDYFQELLKEAQPSRPVPVAGAQNVADSVKDIPKDYYNAIGDKSALRRYAAELFPSPPGVKAWGKAHLLTNDAGDAVLGAFLRSSSWRNPVNAADKLQAAFVNLMKRLTGLALHALYIPTDDWNEKKRKALGRHCQRIKCKAVHFDNLLAHGYIIYLVDTPLKGATPVTDLEATLVSALKGIRPPQRGDDDRRFHPIDGSPEWVDRLYEDPDRDRGKWHVVAVAGPGTKDLVDLEIVAVSEGLRYEWVKSYWRLQQGPGILIYGMSVADWLTLLAPLGYVPTKLGRHLAQQEEGARI